MTVQNKPFILSRRKDTPFFYVRFKGKNGKYLTATSTKKTDRDEAEKTAWKWYSEGKIERTDKKQTIEAKSISEEVRKSDLTDDDILKLIGIAKQRGIIKSFVKAGDKCDIPLADYLLNFWDWDKSEYIKEKLRREKSIGRARAKDSWRCVKNYWIPYFGGKLLGELTKQDLREFLSYIQTLELANATKNKIWLAGAQAIRYAYNNEIIDRDITAGLSGFYGGGKPREILTPELAQAVFSVEWRDQRAYLANLLAMCTGLRSGEIRALRKQDLGRGCIYVRHSWSPYDGLKSPKNGETRIVLLPFPQITESLLELADSNPFTTGINAFVFYATIPDRPTEEHIFRDGLHEALQKIGMDEEEAKKYCFHAWRHFYAAYMRDRISDKLLQSQTGHKTLAMLEHYSNHRIAGDDERIEQAQTEIFGGIVNHAHLESFDKKELYHNIQLEYMDKSGMYAHTRADRKTAPRLTEKGKKAAGR